MSAVASGLSFEVLRFTVEPVSAEVALLELEGRFRADTRRRLGVPRLMAESDDGSREVAPAAADEAQADPDGGLWRASYAVALELLEDGSFALAVGRELLVGLPAPDLAEPAATARCAWPARPTPCAAPPTRRAPPPPAALASAGTERHAREAAEAQMAEARMARDDHARRAASLDDELAQLRREHAAELVRRDEEQAAALAGRDEEAARAAEERVAELEAPVSLSSATVEQLDALPGVGPVTAQKIVDWRTAHGPFRSVDALDDVPGIGPAKLDQLRDLVTP